MIYQDCPFCQILVGNEPASFVGSWEHAIAIVPLRPVTWGHTLVIPRAHVVDALEDPAVTGQVMEIAATIARRPCNLITSCGTAATQTVNHLHVHIVPRALGDGLMLPWG